MNQQQQQEAPSRPVVPPAEPGQAPDHDFYQIRPTTKAVTRQFYEQMLAEARQQ